MASRVYPEISRIAVKGWEMNVLFVTSDDV